MSDLILTEVQDGVAVVTLNRATARNAVNLEIATRLPELLRDLDDDDAVRVILVRGAGPVFCAGADLKERRGQTEAWMRRRRVIGLEAYLAIERIRKPLIALVHGACVGSGCEIALACDFIIASTDASFLFPEPQWGTVGATQRLQRVVGKRLAKDLLFSGRKLSASEALGLAMVTRVCEAADLENAGRDCAREIMRAPALALALTKQSIDLGEEVSIDQGIRIELAAIQHNLEVGDWRGGLERFAERKSS